MDTNRHEPRVAGLRVGSVLRTWWIALFAVVAVVSASARERLLIDGDWRFSLGDTAGAEAVDFADENWRPVDLPHDWSIEGKTDAAAASEGGGGFFPTGTGWYRKTFDAPAAWAGQHVEILFEGVYRNAEVWLNGVSLGRRPNGYVGYRYDLTPHLRIGAPNTLAVRVDNSAQPNSRYYTGSGLYRSVWLESFAQVHVAPEGVWVRTLSVGGNSAQLALETTVRNRTSDLARVEIVTELWDRTGRPVTVATQQGVVPADGELILSGELTLANPRLWSPEQPELYRARTKVLMAGRVVDETETGFGVRTVRVSAERGFELNGRPLKLFGGNVHHDNGPLGAAAFDRAEERKVELVQRAGFNAIRTSHNPPSRAFLEACDRLGMLVVLEFFDGWAKAKVKQDYSVDFNAWAQRDLEAMVLRDRNHPSVVMWSIGNEMYERGGASGLQIAKELAATTRRLDPTRPISAGLNGLGKTAPWSNLDPLFATLDVAGYNYEMAQEPADHARVPSRVIMSAESYIQDVFASWASVQGKSHVIGDFVWSALDYLGEAGIGRVFPEGETVRKHWERNHFPWHGAACGDLDLIGRRKPVSHYRNIVWDRGEKLYAAVVVPPPTGKTWQLSPWATQPMESHWNWSGHERRDLAVEVYSRHDAVRVELNGVAIGEKPTTRAEEFKAAFAVPYAPGELVAIGLRGGREVERFVLRTAGNAAALALRVDRPWVQPDGHDLVFVEVEAVDANGAWQPEAEVAVKFAVKGPASLVAVRSADLTSEETYQANPRRLARGRGLVVLRTTQETGTITLTATPESSAMPGDGAKLKPATVTVKSSW